jgi:hypothetical protein
MRHHASYVKYFHFLRVNAKHHYMHGVAFRVYMRGNTKFKIFSKTCEIMHEIYSCRYSHALFLRLRTKHMTCMKMLKYYLRVLGR